MINGRKLALALAGCGLCAIAFGSADPKNILSGQNAFASHTNVRPGVWRHITAADLPKPGATPSAPNFPRIVAKPDNAWPQAPEGFKVELYAAGLDNPRIIRTAPNGDLFVAETRGNEIKIFRGITPEGKAKETATFATGNGLKQPFGIAFYPPGPDPQFIYVANTDGLVRFPYKNGDLKASGPAETLITGIPGGGHSTRDIAFSLDGKRLFYSIGSLTNVDDPDVNEKEIRRANILEYTPEGKFVKVYGSGIRNPVGIAVNPLTGEVWCSVNERDALGDNLVPDYVTHVQEGGFYGWPWYYMGSNQDPRHDGKHPELKGKVLVPDVLLQPHNASLELTFYNGSRFPAEYKGDIFAAEHGSWNKSVRTGYEVVRIPLQDGHASGIYEDFLTGFVTADGNAWGRPVGVATASDGSLMVTDDGYKAIWRVSYTEKQK